MCLILIAWKHAAGAPLVIAANRDEAYARPADPAAHWRDGSGIIAGRDARAGGTWLGVTPGGRFAAVTNFHLPGSPPGTRSRGELPVDFLSGTDSPQAYLLALSIRASAYGPFCLLAGDDDQMWWYSSHGPAPAPVSAGIHALGNGLLSEKNPRVQNGAQRLTAQLGDGAPEAGSLLDMLGDTAPPPGPLQPWQSLRLVGTDYGTRCSTVLIRNHDGTIDFVERTLAPQRGCVSFHIDPKPDAAEHTLT